MDEHVITLEQALAMLQQHLDAENHFQARRLCDHILAAYPNQPGAKACMLRLDQENNRIASIVESRLTGMLYLDWLKWFHANLKPTTYVEIGVETGQSLQFARPPTYAIGIDPELRVVWSQATWVKLFRMTSDDFFAKHDLRQETAQDSIDFAFLDGLHTFDQTLRDFINLERFANERTVVLLHDVLPVVPVTASRERKTSFWLGDTWKIIPILREVRPDLKIFTIPTYPSGLAVVTGLDPNSRRLDEVFDFAVEHYLKVPLADHLNDLESLLNIVPNDPTLVGDWLKQPPLS